MLATQIADSAVIFIVHIFSAAMALWAIGARILFRMFKGIHLSYADENSGPQQ